MKSMRDLVEGVKTPMIPDLKGVLMAEDRLRKAVQALDKLRSDLKGEAVRPLWAVVGGPARESYAESTKGKQAKQWAEAVKAVAEAHGAFEEVFDAWHLTVPSR